MEQQTTEYQLAVARVGSNLVPTAYAHLADGTTIKALSLDGACKLAVQHSQSRQSPIVNVGTFGGCYDTSEGQAWVNEQKRS